MRLCIPIALLLLGCGVTRPTIPEDREEAFSFAVQRLTAGEHATAAAAAWRYHAGATPEDPRYDRALRLLARSAEELGLHWAASLWYLEIAQGRRAPELVPVALEGLKRLLETGAADEDTLIDGFIATESLGGLPHELQAFVDYHRGLRDARQGFNDWSNDRLNRIPERSGYAGRAQLVFAARDIADGRWGEAKARLEALLEAEEIARDARGDEAVSAAHTELQRSLARLAMDEGDYAVALRYYESVRAAEPDDPQLLFEMAWAHYHQGDSRRALGLLVALDAPVYHHLIAPDRFLLEALALRRLCQFGPARRAAVRLVRRHGDALRDLYAGIEPIRSKALRASAEARPTVAQVAKFAHRVKWERDHLEALEGDLGPELHAALKAMYVRGVGEGERRLEAALVSEVDALSEELLAAEEGVRLILHELSVALLRGRRRPTGPTEAPPVAIEAGSGLSLFRFEGEFWTDELDDLVVIAEDRCID